MNDFKLPKDSDEKSVLKTIRLKNSTLKRIELLSKTNNLSVNRIINECLEYALNNLSNDNTDK